MKFISSQKQAQQANPAIIHTVKKSRIHISRLPGLPYLVTTDLRHSTRCFNQAVNTSVHTVVLSIMGTYRYTYSSR